MANPSEWWEIYQIPDEATLRQQREDEEDDIAWERMYLRDLYGDPREG